MLALVVGAVLFVGPSQATTAAPGPAVTSEETRRVGSVDLHPCDVLPRAWCGTLEREWNPADPSLGTLDVGFAFVPARSGRSVGTLVPHEGGPGYSTTSSGAWFAEMYDGLLDDHDLLLVDQRGMGLSSPIRCRALDSGTGSLTKAAGQCGRQLGPRAGLYGSALSADDLAGVLDALGIGQVDMYGDSYGTFFGQVFAGRHPERLRTLVLDGTYPAYGETAWYPTQGPALASSLTAVCARSAMCARETRTRGAPVPVLTRLLDRLREKPVRVRAPGGDGRLHSVTLTSAAVVPVAYNAVYQPTTYREFTGAVRAALGGDPLPLGRLYAEYLFTGEDTPAPQDYSMGAEVAVSCHDYPMLFDVQAPVQQRRQQYREAFRAMRAANPGLYAPFTIDEYRDSEWSSFDVCLTWPVPDRTQPAGPPMPPGGSYPPVPTLVISGELDTITTPAEGQIVTEQFPRARHIVVDNTLHVAGGAGPTSCGARLVRHVVATGSNEIPDSLAACAEDVPAIRAVGSYPRSYRRMPLPPGAPGDPAARVGVTSVATVADVMDRWWQTYRDSGRGLRGGTFRFSGDRKVTMRLTDVRLVDDLPVSGTATWNHGTGQVTANLRVPSTQGIEVITASWNATTADARTSVRMSGSVPSRSLDFLAP